MDSIRPVTCKTIPKSCFNNFCVRFRASDGGKQRRISNIYFVIFQLHDIEQTFRVQTHSFSKCREFIKFLNFKSQPERETFYSKNFHLKNFSKYFQTVLAVHFYRFRLAAGGHWKFKHAEENYLNLKNSLNFPRFVVVFLDGAKSPQFAFLWNFSDLSMKNSRMWEKFSF